MVLNTCSVTGDSPENRYPWLKAFIDLFSMSRSFGYRALCLKFLSLSFKERELLKTSYLKYQSNQVGFLVLIQYSLGVMSENRFLCREGL